MCSELEWALHEAAAHTFEELCFLCAERGEEEPSEPARWCAASVAFNGPRRGRLELRVTTDVLPELTARMLAVEHAARPLQEDALRELVNVICGNLLPALDGAEAVYQLSAPRLLSAASHWCMPRAVPESPGEDGGSAEAAELAAVTRLQFDVGAAELRLQLY